jgi:hypothetical protein
VGRTTLDIQILNDSAEYHNPQPDPERLEALAQAGGGKVLRRPDELARLVDDCEVTQGETIVTHQPIWDHPAFWCLILLLLSAEWILRRHRGLA